MKYDFILFGGTGQQGRICARDLIESGYSVMLVGRNKDEIKNLLKNKKAGFIYVDLQDEKSIIDAIVKSGADVVVNCAELTFNVAIMKACIKTKRSCTDLGGLQSVTLKQFDLNKEFVKNKITCITGCGSTPGIANVMAAHAVNQLDSVDTIELGFAWDSNIKTFVVPYSIKSIFSELTDAPITFHDGKFVKESRLKCMGTFDFKEVGRQTAYCIVHSEVYTFSKYFKNKGIKSIHYLAGFPDHSYSNIKAMIDLGFNSEKPLDINGAKVKPVDFVTALLKRIDPPKGYTEVEDLWVKVSGKKKGVDREINMNCIVRTVPGWEEAGSNIDTGRTISIMSQMLKKGMIKEFGVFGPEPVIPQKEFFNELKKRKMLVYEDDKLIS